MGFNERGGKSLLKLTEDNFNYEYSGDEAHWKWELANHPRYTNPWTKEEAIQVRNEILSDHEKCTKFQMLNGELKGQIILLDEENKQLKEQLGNCYNDEKRMGIEIANLKEIVEKIRYRVNQFRIEDGMIQDQFGYDALRKILEEI